MLNKKTLFVASAVLSVSALLTGCSSNSASPSVTVTETQEAQIPTVTPEQKYLNTIHSFGNRYVEANTDSDLLNLGELVCKTFDDGYTAEDVVSELAYGVFGQEHAGDTDAFSFVGYVIGAAATNLCPEYLPMVSDLVYG